MYPSSHCCSHCIDIRLMLDRNKVHCIVWQRHNWTKQHCFELNAADKYVLKNYIALNAQEPFVDYRGVDCYSKLCRSISKNPSNQCLFHDCEMVREIYMHQANNNSLSNSQSCHQKSSVLVGDGRNLLQRKQKTKKVADLDDVAVHHVEQSCQHNGVVLKNCLLGSRPDHNFHQQKFYSLGLGCICNEF